MALLTLFLVIKILALSGLLLKFIGSWSRYAVYVCHSSVFIFEILAFCWYSFAFLSLWFSVQLETITHHVAIGHVAQDQPWNAPQCIHELVQWGFKRQMVNQQTWHHNSRSNWRSNMCHYRHILTWKLIGFICIHLYLFRQFFFFYNIELSSSLFWNWVPRISCYWG